MDIVDKKIISIGGGGFTHQTDKFLDEFIINPAVELNVPPVVPDMVGVGSLPVWQ